MWTCGARPQHRAASARAKSAKRGPCAAGGGERERGRRGGMAGRGGPLGPYFRATPVPRNAKLRLSMRFRFKKGAFWISWDLPWGGLWEVVSISKSQLLTQNSIWPTGVADQIRTRGPPPVPPCPDRSFRSSGAFGLRFAFFDFEARGACARTPSTDQLGTRRGMNPLESGMTSPSLDGRFHDFGGSPRLRPPFPCRVG